MQKLAPKCFLSVTVSCKPARRSSVSDGFLVFRDKREICNKLATPAEISRDLDAGIFRMLLLHCLNRMLKQSRSLMQMKLCFTAARY